MCGLKVGVFGDVGIKEGHLGKCPLGSTVRSSAFSLLS